MSTSAEGESTSVAPVKIDGWSASEIPALCMSGNGYSRRECSSIAIAAAQARAL